MVSYPTSVTLIVVLQHSCTIQVVTICQYVTQPTYLVFDQWSVSDTSTAAVAPCHTLYCLYYNNTKSKQIASVVQSSAKAIEQICLEMWLRMRRASNIARLHIEPRNRG